MAVMDHLTGGRSHSFALAGTGNSAIVQLRPSRRRPQRNRLAQAALLLLADVADDSPLLCGCEEPGCPSCD